MSSYPRYSDYSFIPLSFLLPTVLAQFVRRILYETITEILALYFSGFVSKHFDRTPVMLQQGSNTFLNPSFFSACLGAEQAEIMLKWWNFRHRRLFFLTLNSQCRCESCFGHQSFTMLNSVGNELPYGCYAELFKASDLLMT